MSYENLRKGRINQPGRAYFITTVTFDRKTLFLDFYIARILVSVMRQLHDSGKVISLSWVIMPDHLHWLFQLNEGNNLCEVIKALKAISAQQINRYAGSKGSVWQKAYYDRAIRDNEDLRSIAKYIVANPLRASIVGEIVDYPHWEAIWLKFSNKFDHTGGVLPLVVPNSFAHFTMVFQG